MSLMYENRVLAIANIQNFFYFIAKILPLSEISQVIIRVNGEVFVTL